MSASRFGVAALLALGFGLPAAARATPPLQVFHADYQDPERFGKTLPILKDQPAYGYLYVDDEDWYSIIVNDPADVTSTDKDHRFMSRYGGVPVDVHLEKTVIPDFTGYSAEDIDRETQKMVTPGGGYDDVNPAAVNREVLDLGTKDEAGDQRAPQMALWDSTVNNASGIGYLTGGFVVTSKGTLGIYCLNTTSYDTCHKFISLAVRVGKGAY